MWTCICPGKAAVVTGPSKGIGRLIDRMQSQGYAI